MSKHNTVVELFTPDEHAIHERLDDTRSASKGGGWKVEDKPDLQKLAREYVPTSAEHQRHQAIFAGEDVTDFVPMSDEEKRGHYVWGRFKDWHQRMMDRRDRRR